MNLLLDTHLLLWAAARDAMMTPEADALVKDPGNRLHFSVASLWEVAIKAALGRPDFRAEAGALRAGLLAAGYVELAVEGRHVLALTTLPPHHRDPFDRILVAQALAEGLVLLTADWALEAYGGPVRLVG